MLFTQTCRIVTCDPQLGGKTGHVSPVRWKVHLCMGKGQMSGTSFQSVGHCYFRQCPELAFLGAEKNPFSAKTYFFCLTFPIIIIRLLCLHFCYRCMELHVHLSVCMHVIFCMCCLCLLDVYHDCEAIDQEYTYISGKIVFILNLSIQSGKLECCGFRGREDFAPNQKVKTCCTKTTIENNPKECVLKDLSYTGFFNDVVRFFFASGMTIQSEELL